MGSISSFYRYKNLKSNQIWYIGPLIFDAMEHSAKNMSQHFWTLTTSCYSPEVWLQSLQPHVNKYECPLPFGRHDSDIQSLIESNSTYDPTDWSVGRDPFSVVHFESPDPEWNICAAIFELCPNCSFSFGTFFLAVRRHLSTADGVDTLLKP